MLNDRPHIQVAVHDGLPVLQPCTLFECVDSWLNTRIIEGAYLYHDVPHQYAARYFAAVPQQEAEHGLRRA